MNVRSTRATRMWLLKGFVWLIVMMSIFLTIGSLLTELNPSHDWMLLRVTDGFLNKMIIIFSVCAVALFLLGKTRSVIGGLKKIWLFLKARHVLFGWIVAAAATSHSVYFLVFLPQQMSMTISGLAALVIMAPLVIVGFYFDKKARANKRIRILHTILGFSFIAGLIYHVIAMH
ncbi:hypothetical protein E5161_10115 [Cohnella pontilimi]|uniref:Ferric oxidoreductase domain-containing protein n=1 Tax=Cohnella pontilimi TaxID=2564100 RepID=A0A4U0FG46_9BACL|nr:hypothetical protein [Cohnella pontilimi]TJY42342.1 hypothetical protein E5161_10115 [Cohnella pontilimi]